MSTFDSVERGSPIEVFELTKSYYNDSHPNKTNLGVGAYRNENGEPWVLPVVRKTEIEIASNASINHEYLPVCGTELFTMAATKLLLGEDSPAIVEKRAFGVQALSGTGALRLGADFLVTQLGKTVFYNSDPSWANHHSIFLGAGFQTGKTYRYWDKEKRGIDFDGLIADLKAAPENAVVILHACAHNPTGCDPTKEQWEQIVEVMRSKKLFPFFDSAYQGFVSGDPDKDAWAVRYFVEKGFELLAAQSFAKNFGLYSERVGNLTVVQKSKSTAAAILSQFLIIVRISYSTPPAYGSRIVSTVLNDPKLRQEWIESLQIMSKRVTGMRQKLVDKLVQLQTPGKWDHITQQIGMFSYTGLNERQVKILIEEFHIYLLKSGRINMCALNDKNVEYVAKAIHAVVTREA